MTTGHNPISPTMGTDRQHDVSTVESTVSVTRASDPQDRAPGAECASVTCSTKRTRDLPRTPCMQAWQTAWQHRDMSICHGIWACLMCSHITASTPRADPRRAERRAAVLCALCMALCRLQMSAVSSLCTVARVPRPSAPRTERHGDAPFFI